MKTRTAPLLALVASLAASAQPVDVPDAAELLLSIKKLGVVGSALYVAAHPDDENTAMLAYLSRERLVRTGYLSMTRGDGGQNLIGSEKGELIGLVRTQELLAARRIDGARQFFSRAIDFGFSKSPEETLAIWDREKALSDVVFVIRKFRPDVIVTRFPTNGDGGHGHHTASAILAEEAFTAAADPKRFPEQLALVKPWQAKRLLWNIFRFGAAPRKEPPAGTVSVDLGAYNAVLGRSYSEIAGQSRSMHKSQGFGSSERRGAFLNDFQPRLGDAPSSDLFDGVDLTWSRIPGGAALGKLVDEAYRSFDARNPSASVPALLGIHQELGKLPKSPDVDEKRRDAAEAIRGAMGFWTEAIAADFSATPGSALKVSVLALNRSAVPVTVESVTLLDRTANGAPLSPNQPWKADLEVTVPPDLPYTNPYWLRRKPGKGLFDVTDPALIGLPESRPALLARFAVKVRGEELVFEAPVQFRWTDPVKGELYRPFEVLPKVAVNFDEKMHYVAGDGGQTVRLLVKANDANQTGTVALKAPAGWKVVPATAPFALKAKGDEQPLVFTLAAGAGAASGALFAETEGGPALSVSRVDYPHIPIQTLIAPAESRLVKLDVRLPKTRSIGYVMGSGDEAPTALRQLGFTVTLLEDGDLEGQDLSRYGTIVAGVRAYNTRARLKQLNKRLLDYVNGGGRLVVQYSVNNDLVTPDIGPYPFKLSRERVTVEEAPVKLVAPRHALLTTPNAISAADFDGWVQERGLYFATTWDPKYETVLACNDPGEPEKAGGLLYATYGKGDFIYTGLSFFRELPAGVPGAARLFVNLVSRR